MRIKYKRHKSKVFPIELRWIEMDYYMLTSGNMHVTIEASTIVDDIDHMQKSKTKIETDQCFSHWITNWTEINELISNEN